MADCTYSPAYAQGWRCSLPANHELPHMVGTPTTRPADLETGVAAPGDLETERLFHEIRRRIDEQVPYDPGEHHIDNAARAVLPLIEEERRRAVREALDEIEALRDLAVDLARTSALSFTEALNATMATRDAYRERAT